jgi:UDP-N-acetylmuramoyl-tripeptide--D-alanyl-D-alanine ligase
VVRYPLASFQYYVAELGIDKPNDMAYLLTILRPSIGVFLNVGAVHAEAFQVFGKELVQKIAEEKSLLISSLPNTGWAIVNSDDEQVIRSIKVPKTKLVSFGRKKEQQQQSIIIESVISNSAGFSLRISHDKKDYGLSIKNQVLGEHFAYTISAALGVALAVAIPLSEAVVALQKYTLPKGRGSIIAGIENTTIIDSSYNSSPDATIAMLQVLKSFSGQRKIAVLGDMRELGNLTEENHRELARIAITIADEIITVGPAMKEYFVDEALGKGFDPTKLHYFISSKDVGMFMKKNVIKGGEIILIKGSQNTIFLERVTKDLMADPEKAGDLLCRQEAIWEGKRASC